MEEELIKLREDFSAEGSYPKGGEGPRREGERKRGGRGETKPVGFEDLPPDEL